VSQRTRARTTGAAPRRTKVVANDEPAPSAPPAGRGRRKAPADAVKSAHRASGDGSSGQGVAMVSPDALARALRAVAAELERDPALARRVASALGGAADGEADGERESALTTPSAEAVAESAEDAPSATIGRTFHPSIVTGVTPDLGSGVPDPFALRERLGLDGLREALASLRLGSLRAIVREHGLDPGGRLSKLNDAAKLRERIIQAAMKRK
jgi:hypothetical protein